MRRLRLSPNDRSSSLIRICLEVTPDLRGWVVVLPTPELQAVTLTTRMWLLLWFECSAFKERSKEDVIGRYKPVWAVGDELVAVASSSAIKVSLTNRTHLFKTSLTGRITIDWWADAAADYMPRSNIYMHLISDASCRRQKRPSCISLCVFAHCHKLMQLPEQKLCHACMDICVCVFFPLFFQMIEQKLHWSK